MGARGAATNLRVRRGVSFVSVWFVEVSFVGALPETAPRLYPRAIANQTPAILHCPKCGRMQAHQPTCGVCGVRLPGFEDPSQPTPLIAAGTARTIGLYVFGLLGGLVAATALVLWLLFALF